jgi:hypothetical protein
MEGGQVINCNRYLEEVDINPHGKVEEFKTSV